DRTCAKLAPTPLAPGHPATLSAPGPSATLRFSQLRAISYAVAGRAEDDRGRLLAFGCVDVDGALLAAAGLASAPVPLAPVAPAPWSSTIPTRSACRSRRPTRCR